MWYSVLLMIFFASHFSAIVGQHVSHLENTAEEELNRLLRIVVDVENLFICVHKEEDSETKQVYFYLFKVKPLCFYVLWKKSFKKLFQSS